MVSLPTGTVTLLFSDIEGSTRLLSRLGPAYAEALDGQRRVLRRAWTEHGGTELGTEGDSFFVAFDTADSPVAAASMAQRELAEFPWPADERVGVRMGIHTGSPTVHDGSYVGMDVHRAARIAGAAHGGQVVLSEATARLVEGGGLGTGVPLRDLGSHQLKDLPRAEHLFQLCVEGLPSDFPPLRSLGASSSLPVPATPLVGRDGELAELTALLSSSGVRLVTLTGPGGSGKTRLALGVAERLVERFPDGVYFVPLAAVTTAEVMWTNIAEVLDVPAKERRPPALFSYVTHRACLFVLDNLEQFPGADEVVADLLDVARQVVVVATSRRPLHVPGEREHPVPPLELPGGTDAAAASSSGAVQMFVQHAQMVRPSFELTTDNAPDVVAVCRRLDGLPLALELAAARTKVLTPPALLARLDTALDIAASSNRAPTRQRTLRDTIGWSYHLLNPTQRGFFRRLGVFTGGADLDAITAITADIVDEADSLDLVADLVDASLAAIIEGVGSEPRVNLLETIRAYALEQLTACGELPTVRQHHARHYLHVVETLTPLLRTDQRMDAQARLEAEHDNFRKALHWAIPPPDEACSEDRIQTGLQLCGALGDFWQDFGYFYPEGQTWLERAIERVDRPDSLALARCHGHLAAYLSHHPGSLDRARHHAATSVAMCRRLNDASRLAESLSILGILTLDQKETAAARVLFEEAVAAATDAGDHAQLHTALQGLAILEDAEHNHETALEMKRQVLAAARELADPYSVLLDQQNLACSLRLNGQVTEAHELMLALIPDALKLNVPANLMYLAEDYAAILAELGHHVAAVRLLAAADLIHERSGIRRLQVQEAEIAAPIAKTRSAMQVQDWNDAYQEGRSSNVEDVIAQAEARESPSQESTTL